MNWRKDLAENYKKPLVILAGPTAVGKTALSVELAGKIDAEIISADSMQVYRHMDIGTAKIKENEMCGIRHHLIDIFEPGDEFNVTIFKELAKKSIDDITERGKIPILAGGTGFYIQAVLNDISFTEHETDTGLRDELSRYAKENGNEALYHRLVSIDSDAAAKIHPNNVKRVIRAIEYCMTTGGLFSKHNETESEKKPPYNFVYFVLTMDRETLYERIDRRIDTMLEHGLVEEVRGLLSSGCSKCMVSMQGLGYKEVIDYINGVTSYDEMVYILKRDTRHFAKRQLTWFKREKDVIWIDKDKMDGDVLIEYMLEKLREKRVIR